MNANCYKGIGLYLNSEKKIEDIASEVGQDIAMLTREVREMYTSCVRAYEIYLYEKVTQGKAAELAGVNKSIFILFLAKYSLPLEDEKEGKQKLQKLKRDRLYQTSFS